jgi:hypothetical protein
MPTYTRSISTHGNYTKDDIWCHLLFKVAIDVNLYQLEFQMFYNVYDNNLTFVGKV